MNEKPSQSPEYEDKQAGATAEQSQICPSCGQKRHLDQMHSSAMVPDPVVETIKEMHPQWSEDEPVCQICIEDGKERHFLDLMDAKTGQVGDLEQAVLTSLREETVLSENENQMLEQETSPSEKIGLRVALLVGSWYFALAILLFLVIWLAVNYVRQPFEPFPMIIFGVISAVLATLAALYGPFILMSQQSMQERDRIRAESDYQVNLKAELEIQYLSEAIEKILLNQETLLATQDES